MLADVISSDSSISIGLVMTFVGLVLGSGIAAVVSAVTTRNKVAELEKDEEAILVRLKALEDWRLATAPLLAVLHERVSPGRGSRPLPQAGE